MEHVIYFILVIIIICHNVIQHKRIQVLYEIVDELVQDKINENR